MAPTKYIHTLIIQKGLDVSTFPLIGAIILHISVTPILLFDDAIFIYRLGYKQINKKTLTAPAWTTQLHLLMTQKFVYTISAEIPIHNSLHLYIY